MTLGEALALQPKWVEVWNYFMVFMIVILPLSLLVWRQTRLTAVLIIGASLLAGYGVFKIFDHLGYVKLLGLPHIILWTPLLWFLFRKIKSNTLPEWPRRILLAIAAVFLVSLLFDYVDVVRYAAGDRIATAGTTTST